MVKLLIFFFDELKLKSDEKYFETWNEILKHGRTVKNEPVNRKTYKKKTEPSQLKYLANHNFMRKILK
jgi:hypothetical protein